MPLTEDIDVDLKIVEVSIIDVANIEMILWRVHNLDSSPFKVTASVHIKDMWSAMNVLLEILANPPIKALTINSASSSEGNVLRIIEFK